MQKKWYEESFGEDYLVVYRHRDFQGAYEEVRSMIGWLNLEKGAEVLDLCCGMGRHSLALHDFGYRVTGMDLSDVLLREARKKDPRGNVRWIRGDMRRVPLADESFDAVVNLFTSFGYFEKDEENAAVLREISRVLRPGGRFIIDFLNPDYVVDRLVPYSERTEGPMRIEERRFVENGYVQKKIRIREPSGPERRYLEKVKLYHLPVFEKMARENGLAIEQVYGNYDQSDYEEKSSPRMIMVGTKRGGIRDEED